MKTGTHSTRGRWQPDRMKEWEIFTEKTECCRCRGGFAAGLYEGQGTLYDDAGRVEYEGTFAAGRYDGEGSLYEAGTLVYAGGFSKGLKSGERKTL